MTPGPLRAWLVEDPSPDVGEFTCEVVFSASRSGARQRNQFTEFHNYDFRERLRLRVVRAPEFDKYTWQYGTRAVLPSSLYLREGWSTRCYGCDAFLSGWPLRELDDGSTVPYFIEDGEAYCAPGCAGIAPKEPPT